MQTRNFLFCIIATLMMAACAHEARLPISAGVGPDPVLPPPPASLMPVVNIAPPKGWAEGQKPAAAPGTRVTAFADQLKYPRWVYVLPNGDVLVAETGSPPKPKESENFKGWVMKRMMKSLATAQGARLPPPFTNGMFVGQHGSWNRKPHSGYKVVFVPFEQGRPVGQPIDLLTGFLTGEGEALGRPVGVAVDKQGALLVVDDVGDIIWRVTSDSGISN